MIKSLNKQGFEEAIGRTDKRIVVAFKADWCPYCRRIAPVLEELSDEYSDEIEIYNVDIDDNPDMAEQYDVMTIPTVFVFKSGEEMGSAVNPGTKNAIIDLIFQQE